MDVVYLCLGYAHGCEYVCEIAIRSEAVINYVAPEAEPICTLPPRTARHGHTTVNHRLSLLSLVIQL